MTDPSSTEHHIRSIARTFLLLTLLALQLPSKAQKSISTHRLSETIRIDGEANEAAWLLHLQDGKFTQTTPNNGQASIRKTEIALLNDEAHLYVLAILHVKREDEINARLSARDNTGNADLFGIQIDPFGQAREGYDFTVTAAGVQLDEKISANGSYLNFNVVWESAVQTHSDRWVVEMKIPFNSIRFPQADLRNFKINFQRISSTLNEESYWNPVLPNVDGFLNQFGRLEGLKELSPPLNLSYSPFLSMVNEQSPDGSSRSTINGGLDLKYVHNNAYTLDLSLIPDFSQAPSDDQIFNLSPFEVKYNENRQFFVEGTEIFDKGGYLYTRRIGGQPINKNNIELGEDEEFVSNPISSNILNLIKFTGKSANGFSVGVLNGITAQSEAEIRNTETGNVRFIPTNPLSNYNSIVLDKTLKNNSSITLLNNSVIRSGNDYDSDLTALLFQFYDKERNYLLKARKAISQKYSSVDGNEFGHQYFLYLAKVSGKLTGGVSGKLLDEKFDNNDFGFLSRNNNFQFRADVAYTNTEPTKVFSEYQISLDHSQRYHFSEWQRERYYFKLNWYSVLKKNNHTIYGSYAYVHDGKDFYEPRTLGRYFKRPGYLEAFVEYQTNRNKSLSFAGYLVKVDYLDTDIYTTEFIAGYGLRARLGQHLHFRFEQDLSKLPASAGYLTNEGEQVLFGKRSVDELTNSFRIDYAVNSKLSMRFTVRHYWIQVDYSEQYTLQANGELSGNALNEDVDAYDDNFNSFNVNFLATWQFAPASEISLGIKLGSVLYDQDVRSSYFDNLDALIALPSSNTASLKVVYFVDHGRFIK